MSNKDVGASGIEKAIIIAKAPGRVNIIGGHTDYNQGWVLPGAINKYFTFKLKPRADHIIKVTAFDTNETIIINSRYLEKTSLQWANFLIGILLEFKKKGINLKGFDAIMSSEVPIGSGLSSSSSLECAILKALDYYYKTKLSNWDLIEMSQSSNHNFMGINCGILDQFASLFGEKDKLLLLNCQCNEYRIIKMPKSNYTWLVINTNVKHNNLDSGYNDRVNECLSALKQIKKQLPSINTLSDIKDVKQIEHITFENPKLKKRAKYIIKENSRVHDFVTALGQGDFRKCGKLLYATHKGLAEEYEVSCEELDFLVDRAKEIPEILGARMMGGGFGGCTINLVSRDQIESIKNNIKKLYQEKFNIAPDFYTISISEGASVPLKQN